MHVRRRLRGLGLLAEGRTEASADLLELRRGAFLARRREAPDRPGCVAGTDPADAPRGRRGVACRRRGRRGPQSVRPALQALHPPRLPTRARGASAAADWRREAERDHDLRPPAACRPLAGRGSSALDAAKHDQAASGGLPASKISWWASRESDPRPGVAGASLTPSRDRLAGRCREAACCPTQPGSHCLGHGAICRSSLRRASRASLGSRGRRCRDNRGARVLGCQGRSDRTQDSDFAP